MMKMVTIVIFLLFFALSNAKAQMSSDCQDALVGSLNLSLVLVGKERLIKTIEKVNTHYRYRKQLQKETSDSSVVTPVSYSMRDNEIEISAFALFSMVKGDNLEDKISNLTEVITICFNNLSGVMKEKYRYKYQHYYWSLARSCFVREL